MVIFSRQIRIAALLVGMLILGLYPSAQADDLKYIRRDGLLLYYPANERPLAAKLVADFPVIVAFLEQHGLVFRYPLHVILDDELDLPQAEVHMIPHREIRLPLRAPGVLEDGFQEADPWSYYLFQGLCLQGIYALHGGIPGQLHKVFGEIVSPNAILPQWAEDGISHLLYTLFRDKDMSNPLDNAIYASAGLPTLDNISNHPERWPGHYGYRIYGRPFIKWVYQRFGWEPLYDFLYRHGSGIIPIEIDLKARRSFGHSWSELWQMYREAEYFPVTPEPGLPITGYWPEPFIFWHRAGVYPGFEKRRDRGRYGNLDQTEVLRLSEYDDQGIARLVEYHANVPVAWDTKHIWDPGPGRLAITRRGRHPYLIRLPAERPAFLRRYFIGELDEIELIPAPPGVIQLSGPVSDEAGRIAVAGNTGGNWDIWIFDRTWQRITFSEAIDLDPWWHDGALLFASNLSGRFQIYREDGRQLTHASTAAMLPRNGNYLRLTQGGWVVTQLTLEATSFSIDRHVVTEESQMTELQPLPDERPFSPWPSIGPNYLIPDVYIGGSDFQIGVATKSRDVTRDYKLDMGLRYSFDTDYLSGRLGIEWNTLGLRFTRYAVKYETKNDIRIDESRYELRPYWKPIEDEDLEIGANWRSYEPLEGGGAKEYEFWASTAFAKRHGNHKWWVNLDIFPEDSQSLYGGIDLLFGKRIHTAVAFQGGQTWGDLQPGHNTYRIGGNVEEGYFTQRPTRLFPLRGFDSNILEDGTAATGSLEIFWPVANLQRGHKTFPLFLHRLRLGTFVDTGFVGERPHAEDMLWGAGFELVTSMEIAWGYLSAFRMGVAWPIKQPDYLDQEGPVFLIQLGKPL